MRSIVMLNAPPNGAPVHKADECVVLSGAFAFSIQAILFILSFMTLVIKWKLELPQRTFGVFLRDSSKQVAGSTVVHCCNLGAAMLFTVVPDKSFGADECSWYWLNIVLDTTVGVFICYILLKLSEKCFNYSSGRYDIRDPIDDEEQELLIPRSMDESKHNKDPIFLKKLSEGANRRNSLWVPDPLSWTVQIIIWCVIMFAMKCQIVFLLWIGKPILAPFSVAVTHLVPGGSEMRLILVMIITPMMMNIFQFWVQDNFLKWAR